MNDNPTITVIGCLTVCMLVWAFWKHWRSRRQDPTPEPTLYQRIASERANTHMHILGSSGSGKSRFIEWMMRWDLYYGRNGFCLVDFHGDSYRRLLSVMAHLGIDRKIAVFDLSNPTHVLGLDVLGKVDDPLQAETETANAVSLIAKMTGNTLPSEMPSFKRVCSLITHYCIETGRPLNEAVHLLNFSNARLRQRVIKEIKSPTRKAQWMNVLNVKNQRDWHSLVLSTENRIADIVASPVARYMCAPDIQFNFETALDEGWIVLVNLSASAQLHPSHAKMFASLLLHQFFLAAMRRQGSAPFVLYLDEVQNYITADVASILDQARKRNLHLVLAHHHLEQEGFRDPSIRESVLSNARIRAVFGGVSFPTAIQLVPELFIHKLNADEIKEARTQAVLQGHAEEARTAVAKTTRAVIGDDGATSELTTETTTETTAFVPQYEEQEIHTYYSLGEKHSRLAEDLVQQGRRKVWIKVNRRKARHYTVPALIDPQVTAETLSTYMESIYAKSKSVPAAVIDEQIRNNELAFISAQLHENKRGRDNFDADSVADDDTDAS